MNFGTPQEMYDDDRENNPTTLKEDLFGFFISFLYIIIICLIFKYFI
jgi:hypothetical protein